MARWRAAPSARSAAAPARPARSAPSTTCFPRNPPPRGASTPSRRACRTPASATASAACSPPRASAGRRCEGTRIEGLLRWRQTNFGLDDVPRDDPNYSAEDRRWYGQLRGETRLFDGIWTTGLRLAATEDRRRYVNLPDALSPATADDLFVGTRTTLDWGNTVRLPALGALRDGALGFGVTHGFEESRSASGSPFFRTTVDANQHTTAGYATLQYRLLERLDMTAGPPPRLHHRLHGRDHLAARRDARAAGDRLAPAGLRRHRLRRAVAVPALRRHRQLLPRQSGFAAGAVHRLGGGRRDRLPRLRPRRLRHHLRHLLPEPHPRPDQFRRRLPDADQHRPRAHPGRGARPDLAPRRVVRDDGGVDDHRRLRRRDGPPIAAPAGARGERHRAHRAGAARGDRADPALHRPQPGRRLRQLQQRGRRLSLTREAIRRARW